MMLKICNKQFYY